MKTLLRPAIVTLIGLALLCGNLGRAADSTVAQPPSAGVAAVPAPAVKTAPTKTKSTPGVEVAQAISTITGVAISPLLGVGAIGAWKYFRTPEASRANLPWFAQPWFWAPALALVALVFLKDTVGTALPTALKKPLDIAEVFENKISGLVAAGAFVPLIAMVVQAVNDDGALYQGTLMATINPAALLSIITVPVAILVFLMVWMASHVINVLIIISPFTTVDAALKSVRLALLSTVPLSSFINPYFGAAWAIVIIIASYFLAGWALRLTVFGTVFAWDFLTFRSARSDVDPVSNRVFTAKTVDRTPVRSYGKLTRDEQGRLVLTYRPCLILPAKKLVLPEGTYAIGRGLFYPEIVRVDGGGTEALLTLPPRYCGHEEEFNEAYKLAGIQNVGIKALWDWVKGALRSRPAVSVTT